MLADPNHEPSHVEKMRLVMEETVIPLVGISPAFSEFASQWTFCMIEIGKAIPTAILAFLRSAFNPNGLINHDRDEKLLDVIETLLEEMEMEPSDFSLIVHALFEKAASMTIRPRLHSLMVDGLFGQESIFHANFNKETGLMKGNF